MTAIILGGGGPKRQETRRWQDDPLLSEKAGIVIAPAAHIGKRLEQRENLRWSKGYNQLEGELKNYSDDEVE